MKTLYLHIGCGKTGSSALQVWLNNNEVALSTQGVKYPNVKRTFLPHKVSIGNGFALFRAIKHGHISEEIDKIKNVSESKILLSSEAFQDLTKGELIELKHHATNASLEIIIIAYLRDVYDIVYSGYQQLIKRHQYARNFCEYGLSIKSIPQFDAIKKYKKIFDKIFAFHYDSEIQQGLSTSLCKALEINSNVLPAMGNAKVNRSLTLFETELLRVANLTYSEVFKDVNPDFSKSISDEFIYRDPECQTEIILDEAVLRHLTDISEPDIDLIKNNHPEISPLVIFNPSGKQIVKKQPEQNEQIKTLLFSTMKHFYLRSMDEKIEPVMGCIDAIDRTAQGILIQGWALPWGRDSASGFTAAINGIEFPVKNFEPRARPDVNKIYPDGTINCGFNFLIPFNQPCNIKTIEVYALTNSGNRTSPIDWSKGISKEKIFFIPAFSHIDAINAIDNNIFIEGWCLILGVHAIETLIAKIDNKSAFELSFETIPRPDVNRHHPEGSLFSGFRVLIYHTDIQNIKNIELFGRIKDGQLSQPIEIDISKLG